MAMEHLNGPFDLQAALSSDFDNIRYVNADLGEGKPYKAVAHVLDLRELTQDENLATARLFGAAPVLRDNLRDILGFASAWQAHLADANNVEAAKAVQLAIDKAHGALSALRD